MSVAAVNGPENVVVSGEGEAVRRVAARLEARGHETTALAVQVGGQSPLMEGVMAEFGRAAGAIAHRARALELVSNVTGEVLRPGDITPAYWMRHMREPVRFAKGIERAAALGCRVFVEVGPRPVLLGMAQLSAADADALWLPSLRPDRGEWTQLLESVAAFWASGRDVDWAVLDRGRRRLKVPLPTYPFQRRRFWAVPEGVPWNAAGAIAAVEENESSDLVYRLDWVRDGTAGATPVPAPDRIVRALASNTVRPTERRDGSAEVLARLDRLATSYALAALRELGLALEAGASLSAAELLAELGIAERHALYLERLLDLLGERGVLSRQRHGWRVTGAAGEDGAAEDGERLAEAHPEHRHEIALVNRCGRELAAVLRGTRDPLQVLFPDGALDAAEGVYRDSPFSRGYNETIQSVLAQVLSELPADESLRILEVGAGTGGTTAALLPLLEHRNATYTFTDVSQGFMAHARGRFGRFGFVEYRVLDLERPPEQQEFGPGQYHVVIAANVIHATRELRTTLAHVRELLAPGGLLALLEVTSPRAWIDLVFGMTQGWWRFADPELRAGRPLLSERGWIELVSASGFEEAVEVPSAASDGEALQSVLIARVAGTARAADGTRRAWLVLPDRSGVAEALVRLLEDRGAEVLVAAGPADAGDAFAMAEERELEGVVDLVGLDPHGGADDPGPAAEAACSRVLALLRALSDRPSRHGARLWVATRGAEAAGGRTLGIAGLAQAPLWGLGRVAAVERPDLWGGLIDLDDAPAEAAARAISEQISGDGAEDQIAVRGGARLIARLAPYPLGGSTDLVRIHPDASYLVTGGLGALGLHVAAWLVERGARDLVLVGRTGISGDLDPARAPRREGIVRELEARGARVTIVRADVGDADAVSALFAQVNASHPPLRGIVHAAGVAWPRALGDVTDEDLATVFWPKVRGAWNLHRASERLGLDFFILFSSAAAIWGSANLAHYAAANRFLDALAHHRAGRGLPALSVDWGRWEGEGMTSESRHEWLGRIGMNAFTVDEGIAALDRLLAKRAVQATVARMDWGVFKSIYQSRARGPLLDRIGTPAEPEPVGPPRRQVMSELRAAPGAERAAIVGRYLRGEVAAVMGYGRTRPATSGSWPTGWPTLRRPRSRRRTCARGCDSSCRNTWCRPCASDWPRSRSCPTGRSTAGGCPRRRAHGRSWRRSSSSPAPSSSSALRSPGGMSSTSTGSGGTTTSSIWAGTPC